tara:strand:- start:70 stop:1008 length:939 start_codon:yes stop_codon:yes gene_type:complete
MMKNKMYLVTGGAGFIGSNLCKLLVSKGAKVVALDNLSIGDNNVAFLEDLGVDVVVEDIRSYDAIENHFAGVDVVVHLAAMNRAQRSIENPIEANEVNITGALNCLEAARKHSVGRFVNISSSSVYANQRDVLLREDMELAPPHPYGVGKLTSEHYARTYYELFGLETVSLRFFSVYGPRQLGHIDKAGVVAKFIHKALRDETIEVYGDGEQMRNFSYVEDVAECVARASVNEGAVGEVINVANPNEVSINAIVKLVEEVVGKKLRVEHLDPLQGDPARNPANTEKCQRMLGYSPTHSFEEGITLTTDWHRA